MNQLPINPQRVPQQSQIFRKDQPISRLADKVLKVKFWQDTLGVVILLGVAGITAAFLGSFITGRFSNRRTVTGVVSQGGALLNRPFSKEVQSLGDIYNFEDTPVISPESEANREVRIRN